MLQGDADEYCLLCHGIADAKGLHAGLCAAGGDRTVRHNAVRGYVFEFARKAGLRPELEKADLLLPARPDDLEKERRRPADVFLPRWLGGGPAALDFAITSPHRQDVLTKAASEDLAAASDYEGTKRSFLNTEQECSLVGLRFLPVVGETTGAWGSVASTLFAQLARAAATETGAPVAKLHSELLQGLSVRVRRARARAVLKRAFL